MTLYIEFTHDEICDEIPYTIIAETTSRSLWDTGRRKRLWNALFTNRERELCKAIRQKAHVWAITKGVPNEGVKMTLETYNLWFKFSEFCANL